MASSSMQSTSGVTSTTSSSRRRNRSSITNNNNRYESVPQPQQEQNLSDGARLTYRELLESNCEQRPSVREEHHPIIYRGICLRVAKPTAAAAAGPDSDSNNFVGEDNDSSATDGIPQVYLYRKEGAEQAYALLPDKKPISLRHHHPEWGDVYFALIYPRNKANTNTLAFAPPPKRSARCVAIKQLKKSAVNERLTQRGHENPYKEIARLQELGDNKHVLELIEALEDDEYLYIVTPKGIGTLFDAFRQPQFLEPERIIQQLFEILLYLERHRICHRDLSPDNVLFLTRDNLVVLDFGFSLRVPVHPVTNRRYLMADEGRFGTYPYMCPEIYSGSPYDSVHSDLWSVSVIVFNVLTNCFLYKRPDPADLVYRYFILAGGLFHPHNDRAVEVLMSVFGTMGSSSSTDANDDRRPIQSQFLAIAQALQSLDPAPAELLEHLLHIDPFVRWSLAQAVESNFLNNNNNNDMNIDNHQDKRNDASSY